MSAARAALRSATVPAIAKSTRSSGQELVDVLVVDVVILLSFRCWRSVTEVHDGQDFCEPLRHVPVLVTEKRHRCGHKHHSNDRCVE